MEPILKCQNNRWGFVDFNDNWITPPIFDHATEFCDGVAEVTIDGKYGFIREDGSYIFPPTFDKVDIFFYYQAAVMLNNKWAYITLDGCYLTPFMFDSAMRFHRKRAKVSINGKYSFIREDGSLIAPVMFDSCGLFHEGRACVELYGKFGYILEDGSYLVPPIYEKAESFQYGMAAVTLNGKTGYINASGEVVIPFKFDFAANFRYSYADVRINGKHALINRDGSYRVKPIYDAIFHNETWIAVCLNDKYGALNADGKEILPCEYDELYIEKVYNPKKNKYLICAKKGNQLWYSNPITKTLNTLNNKTGNLNSSDDAAIPFNLNVAYETSTPSVRVVRVNGKKGLVKHDGSYIVKPIYDEIFCNATWIAVCLNGKYGALSTNGTEILPCECNAMINNEPYNITYTNGTSWWSRELPR